jgi:thiosulfate/3-mercaptopyruvate sulfurtransferase
LEPWEKALIDTEAFLETVHGQMACIDCHGGEQAVDKAAAHTGLIASPSDDPAAACGACHSDIAASVPDSLHSTLQGYWTAIDARSVPENHPALEEMFGNHCSSCHASCGDCHVSRPGSVGGGLVNGHVFQKTPSMSQNCTACHGSRVGNEYLGKHEGLLADVHFRQERMTCMSCHTGDALHGQAEAEGESRYAGMPVPTCESCHPTVTSGQSDVMLHNLHGDKLSCQVCHSVSYTSCDGCHVAVSETSGQPFFRTEASYLTFLIGRNPLQSEARPYEYVPVRHVPISPTSYEYYGEDLLVNFAALPTWKYATPHNIQRNTPQTEACTNCHGNPDVFLTSDKVAENELEANAPVIVDEPPEMPGR